MQATAVVQMYRLDKHHKRIELLRSISDDTALLAGDTSDDKPAVKPIDCSLRVWSYRVIFSIIFVDALFFSIATLAFFQAEMDVNKYNANDFNKASSGNSTCGELYPDIAKNYTTSFLCSGHRVKIPTDTLTSSCEQILKKFCLYSNTITTYPKLILGLGCSSVVLFSLGALLYWKYHVKTEQAPESIDMYSEPLDDVKHDNELPLDLTFTR